MLRRTVAALTLGAAAALGGACGGGETMDTPAVETAMPAGASALAITSPAFDHGGEVPPDYTCDGRDVSPPLAFSGVPEEAGSLILVVDDPDAPGGTWDHWLVYDIPPDTAAIEEDARPPGTVGRNSWGESTYGGPCPPDGRHRYFFRLYALDERLSLEPGAAKGEVFDAMDGHVLAEAELMASYGRQR